MGQVKYILDNLYEHQMITFLLMRRDTENFSVLDRFAQMQNFELLQTQICDRIVRNLWHSKIDTSGAIFDSSEPFRILTDVSLWDREDKELQLRNKSESFRVVRPHKYGFRAWA